MIVGLLIHSWIPIDKAESMMGTVSDREIQEPSLQVCFTGYKL